MGRFKGKRKFNHDNKMVLFYHKGTFGTRQEATASKNYWKRRGNLVRITEGKKWGSGKHPKVFRVWVR